MKIVHAETTGDLRRKRRAGAAAIAGALAVLLVSACSSKNPDSLIGMNVDENLAEMDANASSNVAAGDVSNDSSDRSRDEAAPSAGKRESSNAAASTEVHAATRNAPDENAGAANQVQENDEQPPPEGTDG